MTNIVFNLVLKCANKKYFRNLIILNFFLIGVLTVVSPIKTLDSQFHYTVNQAFKLLLEIGDHGRVLYGWTVGIDMIFALTYSFTALVIIEMLIGVKYPKSNELRPIILLAITPGYFDLLENACVTSLLLYHPYESNWLGIGLTMFTPLKWYAGGILGIYLAFETFLKFRATTDP